MSLIFYDSTVQEWIETYITSLNTRIKNVLQTAERIISDEARIVEEMSKNEEMDF